MYVISGSFRAFDRRPEVSTQMTQNAVDGGAPTTSKSPQKVTVTEKTSSSDTSYSGGDHADLLDVAGSINWEINDVLEPLWEWDPTNWL